MQIKTLRIKNYRSIKNTEIEFQKLFAFIGKNNTGKSNILKAIQVLFGEREIKNSDFHKNKKEDIEIEAILTNFKDEQYKTLEKDGIVRLKITGNQNIESDKVESKFFLNDKEYKSASAIKKNLPKLLFISDIRNPEKEATAGSNSFMTELVKEITNLQNKKEQKEIEDKLKEIQEKNLVGLSEKISEKIQSVLADNSLRIKISSEVDISKGVSYNTNLLMPDIQEMADGVSILACGTGLQSIFILSLLETYGEIEKHTDSIFLIEEPEVYLHPDYQRKMFSVLREIASDNQVVYTTHSPIMISDLWDNSVRLVVLEKGETIIKDIDIDGVIEELGIKYEDILNTQVVVFVEGDQDKIFYDRIVDKLLSEQGIDIKKNKKRIIQFIPSDSNRTINHYAYLRICTSEFVSSEFFIIIDSDGLDCDDRKNIQIDKIMEKLDKGNKKVERKELEQKIRVLKKYAIESYFLDADLLNSIFGDIPKKDLVEMVDYYDKKYKEGQKAFQEKKMEEDIFQSIFKPKNIFTNKRISKKHREYLNDGSFLKVRNKLAEKCDELSRQRKSIYSIADINHKSFEELSTLFREILEPSLKDKGKQSTKT
jgi:predicted ATP-dependent endonuclease of OLD family